MGGLGGPASLRGRIEGLVELAHVLAGARSVDEVVRGCADVARAALTATSLSISRFEPDAALLRTLVNAGELAPWEEPVPDAEVYRVEDHPSLQALLEGRAGVLARQDDDATSAGDVVLLRLLDRETALCTPVSVEGRVWGELYATRARGLPSFGDDDLALAEAVAAHLGTALTQAVHLERVEQLAYTDQLTGLANRRALDLRLDAAMGRLVLEGTSVTVLLCDVNGLKRVNDYDGHAAGDRLLVGVAALLSATSGRLPRGLAARLGGDEFCILTEGAPLDAVVAAAEELSAEAARLDGGHGVAVGIASTHQPLGRVDTGKRLLRLADAAQYRAKRLGSRTPVLAGRPDEAAAQREAVAAATDAPEPRRTFRREDLDPVVVLAAGMRALDRCAGTAPLPRLARVAERVARSVDAASWWVWHCAQAGDELQVVAGAVLRPGDGVPSGGGRSGLPPRRPPAGGSGSRPGSRESAGALAAGVRTDSARWLVEICTDVDSARADGMGAVLRALVSLAALPAVGHGRAFAPPRAESPG